MSNQQIPDNFHRAFCARYQCEAQGTFLIFHADEQKPTHEMLCPYCGAPATLTGYCRAWTPQELPHTTEPKANSGIPGQIPSTEGPRSFGDELSKLQQKFGA